MNYFGISMFLRSFVIVKNKTKGSSRRFETWNLAFFHVKRGPNRKKLKRVLPGMAYPSSVKRIKISF